MVIVTVSVSQGQQLLWYLFRGALASGFVAGYLTFLGFSTVMACIAAGCVMYSPWAAGRFGFVGIIST